MMSSTVISVIFISALLVHCSLCSPRRIFAPHVRSENADYEEGGKSVSEAAFDADQVAGGSFLANLDETMYYPPEERTQRHADGLFNTAYRKALGQMSARKYLHNLVAKRVGGASSAEAELFSKRHADGVFTDSYSRYRKQMAVKKYLAAVLGTSPEDLDLHPILHELDLGALPDGDELQAFLQAWLQQAPSHIPAL
ncbi:glucagon family neuropeptides-like [Alosa alosa]|nr:adenylate cyclase activating polypeptide 1a [Alosa sapidissima]XP_048122513.1 glucagon family neuropeptides-like [Alosa alosa]